MADTVNLTLTFDKTTYNPGDMMTLSLAGTVVKNATAASSVSALTTIGLSDGTTANLTSPSVAVNGAAAVPLGFALNTVTGSGRTWTIAASGLSATATA